MTVLKGIALLVLTALVLVVMGNDLAAILSQYRPEKNLNQEHPGYGRQVFKKCAICHTLEPKRHKVGPSLYCVVDRPKAAFADFRYSKAMLRQSVDEGDGLPLWTFNDLKAYITNPAATVAGGRMPFPGLGTEEDKAIEALTAYLASQCDEQAYQLVKIRTSREKEPKGCAAIILTATLNHCTAVLRTLDEVDTAEADERSFFSCVPKQSLTCRED